jgi:ABC-type lipoprotein export system ATPase subunit
LAVESLYVESEQSSGDVDWPALEFRDVFRIFRSGPVETVALRGLEMEVKKGEMVAILGPSGSGKSTALSLAAGLDRASAGDVRANGRSLGLLDEAELARYRAEVAIVFQSDNLWPTLSARENVVTALRLAVDPGPDGRADEELAAVGLERRAAHRPAELSGGEQQRVAIAAAAARRAPMLFADEPTGELDRENERLVLSTLHSLREGYGTTVVVVTHSSKVAEEADRVVELRDGRVRE